MKKFLLLLLMMLCCVSLLLASCDKVEDDYGDSEDEEDSENEGDPENGNDSDETPADGEDNSESGETEESSVGCYTVTFDLGYENKKFTSTSKNYKVTEPEEPTRPGYKFVAWMWYGDVGPHDDYYEEYGHPWYFPFFSVTEDITLVAEWEEVGYTIRLFDSVDSMYPFDTFTYYPSDSSFTLTIPYKDGYDFVGWTYSGQVVPIMDVVIPEGSTGDRDYYANWSKKPGEYDITWSKTEIKVKLTNNSNSSELTSGCKRYYAGMDTSAFMEIDTNIRARNQLAMQAANVRTTYSWIEDSETNKGWGGNIQSMVGDVTSGSTDVPDIYCNFAYDMTCAALRGCFANLLDTSYANGNHFRFVEADYDWSIRAEDYFDSSTAEGYYYQYMRSLSLTPDDQLYCLASNYTIDVMRAFLVVPVNVELMNSIRVNDSAAGDRDGDLDHDIEDFYDLVWDYGWDYAALAKYSNAIFQTGGTGPAITDIGDNRVGFAIGMGSGLSAAGILYSSSVNILNENTDGYFEYPATNPDLNTFVATLKALFEDNASKGICTVTGAEGKAVEPDALTELDAIRIRFSKGNVLFGGVIMVGSLEDYVYQKMKSYGQGFGVVPVPLYRSHETYGDEYKTVVHNIARIMAISKASTKFAQCSAWLDYQSRNSAGIMEDYYCQQLTAAVGGVSGEQNTNMLNYIRNHVNDSFDATYEDVIANYMGETDPNATATRWHGMLMSNGYKIGSFSLVYESVLGQKQHYIQEVYQAWLRLDD